MSLSTRNRAQVCLFIIPQVYHTERYNISIFLLPQVPCDHSSNILATLSTHEVQNEGECHNLKMWSLSI
jgi:hypothetical protein